MTTAATTTQAIRRGGAGPWFIVEGVLLIVLGGLAAALPGLAGVAGASRGANSTPVVSRMPCSIGAST